MVCLRLALAYALFSTSDGLRMNRFPNITQDVLNNMSAFHNASQTFWTYVNDDWKEEFVQPAQDAFAPTRQKVGRFLRHAKDLTRKAKLLRKQFQNNSNMTGSQLLNATWEYTKWKLNATTPQEAIENFRAEAKRRLDTPGATSLAALPPGATAPEFLTHLQEGMDSLKGKSLIDVLQIDTSDPGWKFGVKSVKAAKKAAKWINETRHSSTEEVGQKVLDLLHAIPEEKSKKIAEAVLPFIVSNAAIADVPMTPTERMVINYGLLTGVLAGEKPSEDIKKASYIHGMEAIKNYKNGVLREEPL